MEEHTKSRAATSRPGGRLLVLLARFLKRPGGQPRETSEAHAAPRSAGEASAADLVEPLQDLQRIACDSGSEPVAAFAGGLVELFAATRPGEGDGVNQCAYDPAQVAADAVRDLSAVAAARGHELRYQESREMPARIFGERASLRDLILVQGLCACYRRCGGVMTLQLECPDRLAGRLRLDVRVTGAEGKSRHWLAPEGLKRMVDRLGAGLRIADSAASTEWACDIPVDIVEAILQESSNDPEDFQGDHPRILVAEDDPISARIVSHFLEQVGLRPDHVSDGEAALAALQSGESILALLDMQMPGLSGTQVARALRQWEREQGKAKLPLIALTASVSMEDRRRCEAAGMDGFITKPVSRDALMDALEQHSLITPEAREP